MGRTRGAEAEHSVTCTSQRNFSDRVGLWSLLATASQSLKLTASRATHDH